MSEIQSVLLRGRGGALGFAASLTPCSHLVRKDIAATEATTRLTPQAQQIIDWSKRLSAHIIASAKRTDRNFDRWRLVDEFRKFQDELKANTSLPPNSYAKNTLERTLVKLQEYVATRPSPYVIAWMPDFAYRIKALGMVCACQIEGRPAPAEAVEAAFLVDARRSVLISERDVLLYMMRDCYQTSTRYGKFAGVDELRSFILLGLNEIASLPNFDQLPSSVCARAIVQRCQTSDNNDVLEAAFKEYLDLFRYESRIVRQSVPSNLWGSKRIELSPEMEHIADTDPERTRSHLLWSRLSIGRDDEIGSLIKRSAHRVYLAYTFLFTNELIQPAICFQTLPLALKQELIRIQLDTRAISIRSDNAQSGLRNPDKTVKDLEDLESRGYETLFIPLRQSIQMAFQVQFSPENFSHNEKAILALAHKSTPALKNKSPVFVRLTIADPKDRAEAAGLGIKPYDQLLDATFDRAMTRGGGTDPRKIFLFAIVRKGNPALARHVDRGWRVSGETFTLVREGRQDVEYDVIIHDPQ
jgi:hypothetical protein